MLPRVEYSVRVPVSPETAFRAFCKLDRLLHRGIFEEASWIEGKPWQPGSRIRYVTLTPVKTTIAAVVASCRPNRSVALLNHALGITVEQLATFDPDLKGGCRVRMTMEFVGKSAELSDDAVEQAITFYTHDALDSMAALCSQSNGTSSASK